SGGEGRIEATALAAGDLRASQLATTNVLALADLVLDVNDPPGPVPVGQEIVYELRIRNRGTSAAEQVEMVAFFSEGIEPMSVEGGAHELSPGTVVFRNMPAVPAGNEMVYKIK